MSVGTEKMGGDYDGYRSGYVNKVFLCYYIYSDSGLNGRVEYTWTPVTSGSLNYFHITAKGQVLLTVYASHYMQYGDIHRFIVTATDKGSPPLSSTAILDIMYRVSSSEHLKSNCSFEVEQYT